MDILGAISGLFGGSDSGTGDTGGGQSSGGSGGGGGGGMVEIKDIAGSGAASLAASFQNTFTTKFGANLRNLGSGTINAKLEDSITTDAKNSSEATATASTAKADQGSSATSSAATNKEGGAFSTTGVAGSSGLPAWAMIAGGAAALAAIIATLVLTRRKKR